MPLPHVAPVVHIVTTPPMPVAQQALPPQSSGPSQVTVPPEHVVPGSRHV
jgi:hypothetical protein